MEIKIENQNGVNLIKIIGNLDGTTAQQAQDTIVPLLLNKSLLVFNMEECPYVSSAGLRVLLVIAKKLANIGGKGALANVPDEVKDVMEMTGFDNIFKTFKSVVEAVEAIKKED